MLVLLNTVKRFRFLNHVFDNGSLWVGTMDCLLELILSQSYWSVKGMPLMFKKILVLGLICVLTACTIKPNPFDVKERYNLATKTMASLFADKPAEVQHLDFYEALARSVKNNLDYRIKIVNIALQAGQLDVALYAMMPALNASSTLYTRSNDYSVSGINSQGVETGLSSSTPRTLLTGRVAMSWNILDFGMGYVKAKQQGDRLLIAREESRRQLQHLGQDVLVAYSVAYSAQQLLNETKEFQRLLTRSKLTLERAINDKMVPKENLLNYQAALLDGNRSLIQLQHKYDKAMLDLKHLLFLPVDQKIILAPPPRILFHTQNLRDLNLGKMDAVTLVDHPELRGQNYQERLVQFGLKTVLLQALPGLTLNYGWNYDSNKFLQNNKWLDKSVDVAWNLLNLASLPATYKTADMQVKYENIKAMAMTMAALTETRYAYTHYLTLSNEYHLAQQQTQNARELYKLNLDRKAASLASDQQVILAKLKAITAKTDEDLLLSDLSVSLGQLYLSVGVDLIPEDIIDMPLPQATAKIRRQFNEQSNFAAFINKEYYKLFKDLPIIPGHTTYTIQLRASSNLNEIEALKHNNADPNLHIAKIHSQNREWYILTYGKYITAKDATENAMHLSNKLRRLSPWIRRTDNLTWL